MTSDDPRWQVIKAVHADLRSGSARSVRESLHTRRRAVLKGVVVVFSGGLLSDSHHPERCAPWRMAEALGASCAVKMDVACVTHVVSQQADTGSVRKALGHASRQIHAVKPTWLLDCATRWCRQSEALYAWTLPGLGGAAAGEGTRGSLEGSSGLYGSSGSGCRAGAGSAVSSASGPSPLSREEMREEMRAVASLLPSTLPKEEKLKELITFFARDRDKSITLLSKWPPKTQAEQEYLLQEIKAQLGGNEPLSHLLSLSGY
jgi:hypothetical protein